jgi:Ankyrin repeats (3 copies)
MVVTDEAGWSGMDWNAWTDLALIRARLDAGADPNSGTDFYERPLHQAAEEGSPEVVAELARRVDDIDAEDEGRTALWLAVFNNRPDNARALVAAGADPWRPMMNGWSPGRLSLATPTPDLFTLPSREIGLSTTEAAAVSEARRLIAALGDFDYDGLGLACVDRSVVAGFAELFDQHGILLPTVSGGDRAVGHRLDQLRQFGVDTHRLALLDQVCHRPRVGLQGRHLGREGAAVDLLGISRQPFGHTGSDLPRKRRIRCGVNTGRPEQGGALEPGVQDAPHHGQAGHVVQGRQPMVRTKVGDGAERVER